MKNHLKFINILLLKCSSYECQENLKAMYQTRILMCFEDL
jgi:hypothetical protein